MGLIGPIRPIGLIHDASRNLSRRSLPMKIKTVFCASALVCSPALGAFAQTRSSLTVGPLTVQPGAKASGMIQVPAGKDEATTIPVSVIHGAQPGPTLALIAGNHGYEYTPIIALQRLLPNLDPKQLSGALILVHVANMPSFLKRTIYYSPVDGKNLNRVFPGRADGTISERIAFAITHEVIERATHVIDLHGGDGNESLRPYSYWITTGDPTVVEGSRELALAFGLGH